METLPFLLLSNFKSLSGNNKLLVIVSKHKVLYIVLMEKEVEY